jgi:hypothetical protein
LDSSKELSKMLFAGFLPKADDLVDKLAQANYINASDQCKRN